jgi:RNA polymerase sigma-70 factor (ECF subfamily)
MAYDAETLAETPSSDERLDAAERQAMVIQAIASLPERTRLIATLRWVDGLTYPEIAQRAGISVKGVEKAIARAFTMIQRRLTSNHSA